MSTLLESSEALRTRGLEVNLTPGEIDALIGNGITSMAKLAFAAAPPGTVPTDDQINALFGTTIALSFGSLAAAKRLVFESQTLIVADMKSRVDKREDASTATMAPAERESRINAQRKRLGGLRLKGDEENAFANYDLVLQMMERDSLIYLAPERFQTRRFELQHKKQAKEIAIDDNVLTLKDRKQDFTCSTRTELETMQALRRRALAFDLVGLCDYNVANQYNSELIQHLQETAPPGYSEISVAQVLRADRAAFLHLAERLPSLKKRADGSKPFQEMLQSVLAHPTVSFHLLPLARGSDKASAAQNTAPKKPRGKKRPAPELSNTMASPSAPRARSPSGAKGKGKSAGKRRGRGPNVPKPLINKSLETSQGQRICWAYNLSNGCKNAMPGQSCNRGVHVCAEPGCEQAHSLLEHQWSSHFVEAVCRRISHQHSHEFFCIEVFSGSGRLTACLRAFGMNESFGVDRKLPQRLTSPTLQMDLMVPIQVSHLKSLLADPACIYCHFAPPCGTASRARLIQRKGRYNPPILRTDEHPNGLPTLEGVDALKVQNANHLYHITCELATFCHDHAILFCIENPGRSFMWDTDSFRAFLQTVPHMKVQFHHCQYGSSRRKLTTLIHNIPSFSALAAMCPGDHEHEPWGQTSDGWATAEETSYPWQLCRAISHNLCTWLQDQGMKFQPLSFAQQEASLNTLRAASQIQSGRPLPPLVPEFAKVIEHPAAAPLPPQGRLLSTPRPGWFASATDQSQQNTSDSSSQHVCEETTKTVKVGIHWTPEEFMSEATKAGHPSLNESNFPRDMLEVIEYNATHSDEFIAKSRTEELRTWIALRETLKLDEDRIKQGISERRRVVLRDKPLTLLQALIERAGHEDVTLPECLRRGFDLTGKLPRSHFFSDRFRPASLPCESLRKAADKARDSILASVKSSGSAELDELLFQATEKEILKGYLEGPVPLTSVPTGGTLTKRFPVRQRTKVRPIDDYRASLVNSSVTQPEGVSVHTADHVAAMIALWMQRHERHGKSSALLAKCFDLEDAYKQVPLSDAAYELDSYLAIFNPRVGKAQVYRQKVLPFGSVASVTAFLRCSSALWAIGTRLLHLAWSSYFDDFLSLSSPALAKHVDLCVSFLFHSLGWRVAHKKLVPFDQCCKVLGVVLDLSESSKGLAWIKNTQERGEELVHQIDEVLECGRLKRHDGERLRGRLQFASGQLFGRRFKLHLGCLNRHIASNWTSINSETRSALESIRGRLKDGMSRKVTAWHSDHVHLYFDASFSPGGYSGVGSILVSSDGVVRDFISEQVPSSLIERLKAADESVVIQELEALAILVGLSKWRDRLVGTKVILFTDSEAIKGALLRCKSNNPFCDRVVAEILEVEECLGSHFWVERVPSQSNPSDKMSREVTDVFFGIQREHFDLERWWDHKFAAFFCGEGRNA